MSHASFVQDLNLGSTKEATDVVSVFNGAGLGHPTCALGDTGWPGT
jgi:adenosylcobinamide amidohydrolase